MKKILFIGPLPPPIDGQSKATAAGFDALNSKSHLVVIDLNRNSLRRDFVAQILRIFTILLVFIKVFYYRFRVNSIYLSISESTLGNIKDIIIYILLIGKLNNLTIQMLGGSGINSIVNNKKFISKVNKFFISKFSGVIVEGKFGKRIFQNFLPDHKINIINNFSDEFLFISDDDFHNKFKTFEKINILYLSNMIKEKGYYELAEAFINLPVDYKNYFSINFVGCFSSNSEKNIFLKMVANEKNINYLGPFLDGVDKKNLYLQSHIFCLPTYYPYEGQPISILEAYATGCVVMTTMHALLSLQHNK
jgi:glycosyltransferase involved in cell wall biosynthesis